MSRAFTAASNGQLYAYSYATPAAMMNSSRLKTTMAWIRPSALHLGTAVGYGRITGGISYQALGGTAEGKIFAESEGDSIPAGTLVANTWAFVCMVTETEHNLRAWLNTSKATSAVNTSPEQTQSAFTVGALNVNGSVLSYFQGEVAEVAVFEGVLSDANIKLLAEKHNPVNITLGEGQKLVGYWPLKGESGTLNEPSYEGLGPELVVGSANAGKGTSSPEIEAPGGAPLEEKSGSVTILGGGNPAPTGSKSGKGASEVLGGGKVEVAGLQTSLDTVLIVGGGTQTVSGFKSVGGSVVVKGGGNPIVSATTSKSGHVEVIGGGKIIARNYIFAPVLDTENGLVIYEPPDTGAVLHVIPPERSLVVIEPTIRGANIYDVPQTGVIVEPSTSTAAKILTPERSLR